ncbi:MAG: M14 family zinc carboxypeptidase [Planctomycetota bacterium]
MRTEVVRSCWGLAVFAGGICSLALGGPQVETVRIGTSYEGRAIEAAAVGTPGEDAFGRTRDERPALLVVAGLQGHHAIGRQAAESMIGWLVVEHAELFETHTLYVISAANPDGIGRWADRSMPRAEWGRAPEVMDADGDGRTSEDGADDLNGDGLITLMRVPIDGTDLASRYGLEATHVIDPNDGRVMREPDAGAGERATHVLIAEGIDNDGDGRFNEDGWGGDAVYGGGGGVDFDRHWPLLWPEHTDGAGLYPLERPGARAIAEWVQSRGNIVGVVVLGLHDTLSKAPPAGKFGPIGEVPIGIEKDDADAYAAVSDLFKETTGITGPDSEADRAGSFLQWAYADLGVYAFGSPVWVRPEQTSEGSAAGGGDEASDVPVDPEEAAMAIAIERDKASLAERGVPDRLVEFIYMTPERREDELVVMEQEGPEALAEIMQTIRELPMDVQQRLMALGQGRDDPLPPEVTDEDRAAAGAGAGGGAGRTKKKAGDSPDAKWLSWMDGAGVDGFVDWAPFDHPQLGAVEIGGFAPGVRINPPESMVEAVVRDQAAFVGGLMGMLPDLLVGEPVIEAVADGLWRISIEARNRGRLDTVPAIGVKARRIHGLVMVLDPGQSLAAGSIVSGPRVVRASAVGGSGGVVRGEWLVAADEGGVIGLEVRSPRFGDRVFEVRLGSGSGGGR